MNAAKHLGLITAGLIWASAATAQSTFNWQNPDSQFTVPTELINQSRQVRWMAVDDVNAVCNAENIRRVGKPIGYTVRACQWQENGECIVVTSKRTSIHSLGHELLHCFWPKYH